MEAIVPINLEDHLINSENNKIEHGRVSRSNSWWNTREDQGIPPPKKTNSAYIEYFQETRSCISLIKTINTKYNIMCKLINQIICIEEEMQSLHSQVTDSESDDSSFSSSSTTTSVSDTNADADADAATTEDSSNRRNKVKKSVRFGTLEVRKYDKTLGDNPSCTDGVPTTLDWTYSVQPEVSLDEYETNRIPRRSRRHLVLTPITRRNSMFYHFGFSHEEIDKAADSIKKFQKQRQLTKRLSKNQEKTQEIVQNVTRKLKRIVSRDKIHWNESTEHVSFESKKLKSSLLMGQ